MQQEEQRLQNSACWNCASWWLHRMAKGPRPFQEKMVLFWHGHFATSIEKVPGNALSHVAAKRIVPPPGHGQLAGIADRGRQGPGHADLARPGAEPQGASQRKFRPRGHGTVFARRRPLHREGHHRSRARADRLVAGPAEPKIHLPPGLPRQRHQDRSSAAPAISTATT